jgi:predicted ArsR family transcriptional regulator
LSKVLKRIELNGNTILQTVDALIMAMHTETSDAGLLAILRERGPLSIAQLIAAMDVTATAVRQRLVRLMAAGLIQRQIAKPPRGRPSHKYLLTEKARRQVGSNFADLTLALWQEIRSIPNPEIRAGLLKRIAKSLAKIYGGALPGGTITERMHEVAKLMSDRNVSFSVVNGSPAQKTSPLHERSLPILTADACPYPDLAEQDRGICAVEKMLFSELLGEKVRLSQCRLDGATCCQFETN